MNNILEIQEKIIKYLSKKGIDVVIVDGGYLTWNYNIHYSKFSATLMIRKENYYDTDYNITYHVRGASIKRLYKRKTSTASSGFCLRIYKNFLEFKTIFDQIANDFKIDKDIRDQYCIELTRYYSRLHHKIELDITKNEFLININITGYDKNCKQEKYYCIKYRDNKYYLNSVSDYRKIFFESVEI